MTDTRAASPLLSVENLEVLYSGVILALKGMNLQVQEGQCTALLGPNGAGKSTTLKAISGMLKVEDGEVSAGTVRYGGQDQAGIDVQQRVAQGIVHVVGDIQEFERAGDRFDDLVDAVLEPLHPAIARLAVNDAPVISVVNGALGGAGVGVALCADIVLASTRLKLRTGYAAIGLSPDLGSSFFLARRVGTQRAKRWLLLSDPIDAETCLQAGAVDALHPLVTQTSCTSCCFASFGG